MAKSKPTTVRDAARVNSTTAKAHGGKIPADSQAARMERAAQRNARAGLGDASPKGER